MTLFAQPRSPRTGVETLPPPGASSQCLKPTCISLLANDYRAEFKYFKIQSLRCSAQLYDRLYRSEAMDASPEPSTGFGTW